MRERKKIKTRAAIREAALQLFLAQGYAETTIDQIVDKADVSARTFYRYFGVKEALLICDQFGPIVSAFEDAPRDLSPAAAYKHAVNAYFAGLTDEERHTQSSPSTCSTPCRRPADCSTRPTSI